MVTLVRTMVKNFNSGSSYFSYKAGRNRVLVFLSPNGRDCFYMGPVGAALAEADDQSGRRWVERDPHHLLPRLLTSQNQRYRRPYTYCPNKCARLQNISRIQLIQPNWLSKFSDFVILQQLHPRLIMKFAAFFGTVYVHKKAVGTNTYDNVLFPWMIYVAIWSP